MRRRGDFSRAHAVHARKLQCQWSTAQSPVGMADNFGDALHVSVLQWRFAPYKDGVMAPVEAERHGTVRAFPVTDAILQVYQKNLRFLVHKRMHKTDQPRVNGTSMEMPRIVADALTELLLPTDVVQERRRGYARNGVVFTAHTAEQLDDLFDGEGWQRVQLNTPTEFGVVCWRDALGKAAPFKVHVRDHVCKPKMAVVKLSFVFEVQHTAPGTN